MCGESRINVIRWDKKDISKYQGENRNELPKAMKELLDYLEESDGIILKEPRMKELDNRLWKVKQDKKAREQYITSQNLIEEEREEAHAVEVIEGHETGNTAIIRKKL